MGGLQSGDSLESLILHTYVGWGNIATQKTTQRTTICFKLIHIHVRVQAAIVLVVYRQEDLVNRQHWEHHGSTIWYQNCSQWADVGHIKWRSIMY